MWTSERRLHRRREELIVNRYDEIQGAARDVADWVCADPADRNRMADDLIRLVSLVVKATGKSVAVAGESAMNGPDSEDNASYELFLVGEDLQRAAGEVREESTGADIERYERDGLTPAWRPDPAKRGAAHRFAPGELTAKAHETADAMREQHKTPVPDERPLFCDAQDCPAHGDAGRIGMCVKDGVEHRWVTTTDGFDRPLGSQHCGVCGEPRCPWIPGDSAPGCDHSSGCTTHGLPSARKCPGAPAATPDIDCATHGNDQARQCVERCVWCGDPVGNGRAHGPNQGFGGCC